jgi:hypothetical protein
MNDSRSDEQLRALLRGADPAADGQDPTPEEHAALRRLVLNRVPDRTRAWRWLPIATAVAAMLVAAVLLLGPDRAPSTADLAAPSRPDVARQVSPEERPVDNRQQIQFATEKGTRIIWVLDPDLTL